MAHGSVNLGDQSETVECHISRPLANGPILTECLHSVLISVLHENIKVEHPAAKMMVLASQQQEQECGDGTNFTLFFSGALLEHAEDLIRMV